MNKPVRTILLGEADIEFKRLNMLVGQQLKEDKENTYEMRLLKSIRQKIDFVKANPFYGESIKKNQIPKQYKVQNLWRVKLYDYWRMLYTIKGDQIEIICFVLEIVGHKKYNKIFGYGKK